MFRLKHSVAFGPDYGCVDEKLRIIIILTCCFDHVVYTNIYVVENLIFKIVYSSLGAHVLHVSVNSLRGVRDNLNSKI